MNKPSLLDRIEELGAGVFIRDRNVESRLQPEDFHRAYAEPVTLWVMPNRYLEGICGGGVVGSEWVDDIHQLRKSHLKFKDEEGDVESFFIFGWDGAGNPLLIDRDTDEVFTFDHNFGGRHSLAPSFTDFYLKQNKEK